MVKNSGVAVAVLCGVALILAIVAIATPVAKYEKGNFKLTITLWRTKSEQTASVNGQTMVIKEDKALEFECKGNEGIVKTARAFGILSIISLAGAVAVGVLVMLDKLPMPMIPLGVIGTAAIFQLITWPVVISVLTVKQCDAKESAKEMGMTFGPCFPLFFVSWVLTLASAGAYMALKDKDYAPASQPGSDLKTVVGLQQSLIGGSGSTPNQPTTNQFAQQQRQQPQYHNQSRQNAATIAVTAAPNARTVTAAAEYEDVLL